MPEAAAIIVLAVKPQTISHVLDTLSAHLSHKPLIISIAAGVALSTLEQRLPEKTAVVRVMPNATALVQQAASALSRGNAVSEAQMEMSLALFRAVGKAVEIDEKLMDAVTGLSGSGPAYVLLMIEALIDAGVLMGLPRQAAKDLVVQTVAGTSRLLETTGKHPGRTKGHDHLPWRNNHSRVAGARILLGKGRFHGMRGSGHEALRRTGKT